MAKELVSVIIPTFNRCLYLQEGIDSVLNQKNINLELIIVNDGSTDQTASLLNSYQKKFPFIKNISQENQGPAAARNTGIKNASGDYIIFLDDDDRLIFNGIEKLLTTIKSQDKNVKIVCGNLIIFYEGTNTKRLGRLPEKLARNELLLQFLTSNPVSVGQVIVEKQAIIEAGGFSTDMPFAEDYDLWTKILFNYDINYIEHPVLQHLKHRGQITSEKRALVRYYSDKVAFKFLQKINIKELILSGQDIVVPEMLADKLADFAGNMLNYPWTHFDTALEILQMAQNEYFSEARQLFIEKLDQSIPLILNKKFGSLLRLSQEEKQEIKNLRKL